MDRWRVFFGIVVAIIALALLVFFGFTAYCALKATKIAKDVNSNLKEMVEQEKREHPTADNNSTPGGTFTISPSTDKKEVEPKRDDVNRDECKAVMVRQTNRLLESGFDIAAGLSREEFISMVPVPNFSDALLVVNENCVSIGKQCDLLGIKNSLDFTKHYNLEKLPLAKLYWIYDVDLGWEMAGISSVNARQILRSKGRRAATTIEILAVYRQNTGLINTLMIDAAGSTYGAGRNPYLWLNNGTPELAVALSDHGHREAGSPSFRR